MSISFGQTISYQDMFDNTVNKIVNMCVNVDKTIPNELRYGYTYRIASFVGSRDPGISGYPFPGPNATTPIVNYFGLNGNVTDTSIVPVSRQDVITNLNDF